MIFSPRRTRQGKASFLTRRIRLFAAGAVLGLAGIFLGAAWLVTAALVVLLAGVVVRSVRHREPDGEEAQGDRQQQRPNL